METALAPVVQRMDSLAQEVEKVKTTTIAREDGPDATADSGESDEDVKRKDPYRGAIFGDRLYTRG